MVIDRSGRADVLTCGHIRAWSAVVMFLAITALGVNSSGSILLNEAGEGPVPADSLRVFDVVEGWVTAWEQPQEYPLPDAVSGVWVSIRRSGRIMGQSHDMQSSLDDHVSIRCLPGVVRQAMDRAERASQGQGDPADRADQQAAFRTGPKAIEIQLAHQPKRLHVNSLDDLISRIRPGVDGILLRQGGHLDSIFPGQMLADGLKPAQALLGLVARENIGFEEMNNGLADGSIRVWSFEVDHLTQVRPGEPASFMHRGTHVVPLTSIGMESLGCFADDLAHHLMTHRLPGSTEEPFVGFLGPYEPELNMYEPLSASMRERAMCAYALSRYAHSTSRSFKKKNEAGALAVELIESIAAVPEDQEIDPLSLDPGVAALVSLTIEIVTQGDASGETWKTIDPTELDARCRSIVQWAFSVEIGFRESLSVSDRAMCAFVLGSEEAMDAAWGSTTDSRQPNLLPWLGWAERQWSDGPDRNGALRSATGLRQMRKHIWAMQVDLQPGQRVAPDLLGGFIFNKMQYPDWKTAEPLTFLATMLSDPRMTWSTERADQILRVTSGLRFLRQLSIRDADRYRLSTPDRALGGVREEITDSAISLEATAMTLITVVESLESLNRMSAGSVRPAR